MYENYFRLRELPFNVTPDPRFLYTSACCEEAFATLCYGVENRKGVILVTGEAGTGKTTLLKLFMQNAAPGVRASCILDPHLSFPELLRCAFETFGMAQPPEDRFSLIQRFKEYLVEQRGNEHVVALLLDESQELEDGVVEELRLLSDLEQDGDRLLQLVLIGQPELESKLDQPKFHQLRQRITLRARLAPLSLGEIGPYIDFRLRTAGYSGKSIFESSALERIAQVSNGIPRVINVVCDNALLIACATARDSIGADIIEDIAEDLQLGTYSLAHRGRDDDVSGAVAANMPPQSERVALREWSLSGDSSASVQPTITQPPEERVPTAFFQGWWLEIAAAAATVVVLFLGAMYFSPPSAPTNLLPVADGIEQIQEVFAPLPRRIYRVLTAAALWDNSYQKASDEEMAAYGKVEQTDSYKSAEGETGARGREEPAKPEQKPQRSAGEDLTVRAPKQKLSIEHGKPEQRRSEFSPRGFAVTDNSFVRDKPTSKAEVIATLHPGERIQVVGKSGDYLRVRSLDDKAIQGYVHKEDAFFRPYR